MILNAFKYYSTIVCEDVHFFFFFPFSKLQIEPICFQLLYGQFLRKDKHDSKNGGKKIIHIFLKMGL